MKLAKKYSALLIVVFIWGNTVLGQSALGPKYSAISQFIDAQKSGWQTIAKKKHLQKVEFLNYKAHINGNDTILDSIPSIGVYVFDQLGRIVLDSSAEGVTEYIYDKDRLHEVRLQKITHGQLVYDDKGRLSSFIFKSDADRNTSVSARFTYNTIGLSFQESIMTNKRGDTIFYMAINNIYDEKYRLRRENSVAYLLRDTSIMSFDYYYYDWGTLAVDSSKWHVCYSRFDKKDRVIEEKSYVHSFGDTGTVIKRISYHSTGLTSHWEENRATTLNPGSKETNTFFGKNGLPYRTIQTNSGEPGIVTVSKYHYFYYINE